LVWLTQKSPPLAIIARRAAQASKIKATEFHSLWGQLLRSDF
jgi:hypothetical protein